MRDAGKTVAALALLLSCSTALGSEQQFNLHGSGTWSYRQTNGNNYLGGTEPGSGENYSVTLVADYTPIEALSFNAQGYVVEDGVHTEAETGWDFGFIEYRFDDALKVRAGLVKQPFGLYNELTRVGMNRPTMDLSPVIYGDTGFVDEGYQGLGITGGLMFANDWEMDYDVYAGRLESRFRGGVMAPAVMDWPFPGLPPFIPEDVAESEFTIEVEDVVGGRINFATPQSIEFGLSAYGGMVQPLQDNGSAPSPQYIGGVHAKYELDKLTISAEHLYAEAMDSFRTNATYVEVSYRLLDSLAAVVRYDHQQHTNTDPIFSSTSGPSIFQQEAVMVGLAWQVHPSATLKVAYENVRGNRFALPDTLTEIQTDGLDRATSLFAIGLDVAF